MQGRGVVVGILVLLQRSTITLGFDRQEANASNGLRHFFEVREIDRAEEQVVDVKKLRLFMENLELVAAPRRGFRHHQFGVGDRYRASQTYQQVAGVQSTIRRANRSMTAAQRYQRLPTTRLVTSPHQI